MNKSENSIFEISYGDALRFRRIVMDVMSAACDADDDGYEGIGTLGEKQMHAAIKRFICPDTQKHEIKLDQRELTAADTAEQGKKPRARRFVADILDGKNVYEIQTGGFAPLAPKIKWIMENTDYQVSVIHPIAETKWVNLIDERGEIVRRYKSPRRESIKDIAGELYFIRDFISNPRFSLVILVMEGEQYKTKSGQGKKGRARYKKYELIPMNLLRAQVFYGVEDYRCFIPDDLEERFTVKEFSAKSGIRGRDAYSLVHTLCDLGLLREDGKIGRAAAYTVTR